jgi:hypothetical protein
MIAYFCSDRLAVELALSGGTNVLGCVRSNLQTRPAFCGRCALRDWGSVTRAVNEFVVSFLMMQLLENLPRWVTLHRHGCRLRLGLNVRFELRQIKDSD